MSIQQVLEFLNSHNIKYTNISYSPAHSKQELKKYKSSIGTDFIETILVKIEEKQVAIAVVRGGLTINMGSLQKALGTTNIRLLDSQEISNLFPNCELGAVSPFRNSDSIDVFLAQDLKQNQKVAFYVDSYNHLIHMNFSDFEKLVNCNKDIVFSTKSKYRALVSAVAPETARQKLGNYDHCFLGVSLKSNDFVTEKLIAITDWIAGHFKKYTVFIADSVHRINLQIEDPNLTEDKALNKALLLARRYIDNESVILERHAKTCPFELVFASEVQKSKDYINYHEQLKILFGQNDKFTNSLNSCARSFVLRHLEPDAEHFDRYVKMSSNYLLEELALTACLVRYGLSVMIYPGSLPVIFGEISNGQYPDVPDCLQQIIHVSLHLRKR